MDSEVGKVIIYLDGICLGDIAHLFVCFLCICFIFSPPTHIYAINVIASITFFNAAYGVHTTCQKEIIFLLCDLFPSQQKSGLIVHCIWPLYILHD